MVKQNQNIKYFNQDYLKSNTTSHIINCIIDTIDLIGVYELKAHLILENCIINNFQIHSCWFQDGLILRNCVIKNYIDYQMGGHNIKPIVFEGNVFTGFFNFFDCQFNDTIELKNNVFMKGTNLLGNKEEGFANTFEKGWIIENNVGSIDLDEIGIYKI